MQFREKWKTILHVFISTVVFSSFIEAVQLVTEIFDIIQVAQVGGGGGKSI